MTQDWNFFTFDKVTSMAKIIIYLYILGNRALTTTYSWKDKTFVVTESSVWATLP